MPKLTPEIIDQLRRSTAARLDDHRLIYQELSPIVNKRQDPGRLKRLTLRAALSLSKRLTYYTMEHHANPLHLIIAVCKSKCDRCPASKDAADLKRLRAYVKSLKHVA